MCVPAIINELGGRVRQKNNGVALCRYQEDNGAEGRMGSTAIIQKNERGRGGVATYLISAPAWRHSIIQHKKALQRCQKRTGAEEGVAIVVSAVVSCCLFNISTSKYREDETRWARRKVSRLT